MQPQLVGILEGEDKNINASLYQMPRGEFTLWLKVGVAIVEIKEQDLDEVIYYLTKMRDIIQENEEDA